MRTAATPLGTRICRRIARSAGVEAPSVRWRYVHDDAWFDNQVASLRLRGREARFALEKTEPPPGEDGRLKLDRAFERPLTPQS